MENSLELVDAMQTRSDVGFVFVGRGSHSQRLRTEAAQRKLSNVLFFDEIEASEIPGLYGQCHVGIVALDVRHKTHNIPGKFISYMQARLPVLAMINPGNDLEAMIATHAVGEVTTQINTSMLREKAERLLGTIEKNEAMGDRCRDLYQSLFTPEKAVAQIVQALQTRAVAS
jgi:glycosyltransferase involved in cell wall biosynthesis